jgi:uncharacterized protein YeaO (DUF488 family)
MTGRPYDIRLKRAYEPAEATDGARVLVDRLWPRGLSKGKAALSAWMKEIAPSPELRRWFGHDPSRFDQFAARYRDELARNDASVSELADLARKGRVTLIYAARDSAHNDAVILADYLRGRLDTGSADLP